MGLISGLKRKSRETFELLMLAQTAHAKWEIETSRVILQKRKKLLAVMLLPVIAGVGLGIAHAASVPDIIGGSKAYLPMAMSTQIFLASLIIGIIAGLITGCIGAGGGFVITPALMSAGVRGIMAVGTDMFHIFAKAIMGTVVHRKLGNVNVPLAIWFVVGSFVGVTLGAQINRGLYLKNPVLSDTFISSIYVLMLGFLGFYSLYDFLKSGKKQNKTGSDREGDPGITAFAAKLQSAKVPPMVHFDQDVVPGGRKISGFFLIVVGFIVGFIASIMGVGGGFVTFPIYVYALGVSSFTTVGTDVLQIIFTAGYSSIFQYGLYGYVFYTLAMGLLIGSLIGVQVGALTTKVVKGRYIRGFYAVAILAGFTNRLFALPGKLSDLEVISLPGSLGQILNAAGTVIFFAIMAGFAIWVLAKFFGNLSKLREV